MDLLNVGDIEQEFEVKTNCLRRKSQDFTKEKRKIQLKLAKKDMQSYTHAEMRDLLSQAMEEGYFKEVQESQLERRCATIFSKRTSRQIEKQQ